MPSVASVTIGSVVYSGSSVTVDYPATPSAGDLLYLVAYRPTDGDGATQTFNTPSGWENIAETGGAWSSRTVVFRRTAVGDESGTITVTTSNDFANNTRAQLLLARVTGHGGHNQVALTRGEATAGTLNLTGVTTTEPGERLLTFVFTRNPGDAQDFVQPSGHTLEAQVGVNNDTSVAASSVIQASAGASGSLAWTNLVQSSSTAGGVVSVLPASAETGPVITDGVITAATTEGFQVRFTTDTANGTAYYVVYPTTSTDPDADQIVAETDGDNVAALRSGNMTIGADGEQTFSAVTGLDPNTTYRVSVAHLGNP